MDFFKKIHELVCLENSTVGMVSFHLSVIFNGDRWGFVVKIAEPLLLRHFSLSLSLSLSLEALPLSHFLSLSLSPLLVVVWPPLTTKKLCFNGNF